MNDLPMPDWQSYPTDLTDEQWVLVEPFVRASHCGPQEVLYPLREVVNAILYIKRTGAQWRYLPHDLPDWRLVYHYFARWKKDGRSGWMAGMRGHKVEVVNRSEQAKGFVLLPKRWIGERTFGWLNRHRRLSKDDERKESSSEAFIQIGMINLIRSAVGAIVLAWTRRITSAGSNGRGDSRNGGRCAYRRGPLACSTRWEQNERLSDVRREGAARREGVRNS